MTRAFPLVLLAAIILLQCGSSTPHEVQALSEEPVKEESCVCDSACLWKVVMDPGFGGEGPFSARSIAGDTLYRVSEAECRELWFRDIESPDTTKFTVHFNSYFPTTYSADNGDFISYYREHKHAALAFQLGPNDDLWAYHSFVVRPVSKCFLITQSYYRHGRFRMKAFAFLDQAGLDTLRARLVAVRPEPTDTVPARWYELAVRDNEKNIEFRKDLEGSRDTTSAEGKAMSRLYDQLDHAIKWYRTYR